MIPEATPAGPLVRFEDLLVCYGKTVALEAEEVEIRPGITGLLGPNGAGKSTLMKTVLGLLKPARGSGRVLGGDPARDGSQIRARIGYMSENDAFVAGLSSVEFVRLAGELSGMPPREAMRRTHEVLSCLGLDEARYRKLEQYSTGMKQRLKLAQALVHDPDLLILDEPTSGLDPTGRRTMLDLIRSLGRDHGKSVLISTHLLEDVERVADSVLVLRQGRIVASGGLEELLATEHRRYRLELRGEGGQAFIDRLVSESAVRIVPPEIERLPGETSSWLLEVPGDWRPGEVFELATRIAGEPGTSVPEIRALHPERQKLETLFRHWARDSSPDAPGTPDVASKSRAG